MTDLKPLTLAELADLKAKVECCISPVASQGTILRLIDMIERRDEQMEKMRRELLENGKHGIIPGWRSGLVLLSLCRVITTRRNWTTKELRAHLSTAGVQATNRQLFNAIGYLVRAGLLLRLGHGAYELISQDGKALAATEPPAQKGDGNVSR